MKIITGLLVAAALASAAGAAAPNAATGTAVADAGDPLFQQPYVDIDEMRATPVPHRYIHGGFRGTETRFSFYFPPAKSFQGRFFQHITPVPDSEKNAQLKPASPEDDKIAFSLASGAYFVETNGGGTDMTGKPGTRVDPTIAAYRANAAAARYSRVMAAKIYPGARRPYGYAFGGSGGAFRTVGSIENTEGVWDGVVPYVLGSPMAPPNMFTIRLRAMRILRDRLDDIVDAVEPGGSGDPFKGLTPAQTAVLREAEKMGFPIPSLFGWRTMGIHGFAALYGGMLLADKAYFTDFWTKPGYLGHDDPGSFTGDRIQFDAKIAAPITAAEAALEKLNTRIVNGTKDGGVDNAFAALQGEGAKRIVAFRLASAPPPVYFLGGDLIVSSGAAAGHRLTVARVVGDVVVLGVVDPEVAAKLAPGDQVRLDNSNFLAAETYHWHQVPPIDAGYPEWDQFRDPSGKPLYPQRPFLLGPLFTASTTGKPFGQPPMTGKFHGKMILVENLWDREALPWQGDWYRQRVQANLGSATDANFRIWYVDHALHGDTSVQEDPTRTVSYLGVLQQALRDLAAWVEKGVAPPASTDYRIVDGQVIVPPTAKLRRGVQPVAIVTADGSSKAIVKAGATIRFVGRIDVPAGTGRIVAAEWDFEGSGAFADNAAVPAGSTGPVTITATHLFAKPGTYFPTLRVISQRQGDRVTPFARLQNLVKVRAEVQ